MNSVSMSMAVDEAFSPSELACFERDGYVIVRNAAPTDLVEEMIAIANDHLERRIEPIEYEADLHYPDAPVSRAAPGGTTIRRLKEVHSRGSVFTDWLQHPTITSRLRQLLGPQLVCPLAHHNCIMTKQPRFSSATPWHQDIRYWSFERRELISVWLALGQETAENGGLYVIPETHRETFARELFDEALFFRDDLQETQSVIKRWVNVALEPGDVLFFHCRLLHAAGKNNSNKPKCSVVFTYRALDNPPTEGSRSASLPEMLIHQ